MQTNSNTMIVNPITNTFLVVNTPSPASGEVVQLLTIGDGFQMSTFWQVLPATGGNGSMIVLQSNPSLCLDINAASKSGVGQGTGLVLSTVGKPNFTNSNIWNLAINSVIASGSTQFVIDAGSAPTSKVWQNYNNPNQCWQLLQIQ